MMAASEVRSPYLSIKEAALYLNVSVHWLYREVARGPLSQKPLPVIRIGKLIRFRREELDAWTKPQAARA